MSSVLDFCNEKLKSKDPTTQVNFCFGSLAAVCA